MRGYSYHGHGGNSYGGYSGSYGGGGSTHGGYSTSYGGGGNSHHDGHSNSYGGGSSHRGTSYHKYWNKGCRTIVAMEAKGPKIMITICASLIMMRSTCASASVTAWGTIAMATSIPTLDDARSAQALLIRWRTCMVMIATKRNNSEVDCNS